MSYVLPVKWVTCSCGRDYRPAPWMDMCPVCQKKVNEEEARIARRFQDAIDRFYAEARP